ncbi:hypothetical protein POVWA2_043560 [Plasmodium ovale wallikeri]|uniref:Uncharacterized protein n=1 Tax=Plasmodium ovale wallikeri TaxID=864142 RepID=A0A1A8ZEV2_PLAOA|nr:hypothetical protein POVWA2_043560 [Plasmodium ovale wallikeri]
MHAHTHTYTRVCIELLQLGKWGKRESVHVPATKKREFLRDSRRNCFKKKKKKKKRDKIANTKYYIALNNIAPKIANIKYYIALNNIALKIAELRLIYAQAQRVRTFFPHLPASSFCTAHTRKPRTNRGFLKRQSCMCVKMCPHRHTYVRRHVNM